MHNTLSTFIWLLIKGHSSWRCLLSLFPFLPQYSLLKTTRNKFLFPNRRRNSFFNSIPPQLSPPLILYPAFIIQKAQGLVKSHSPHAIRTSTQLLVDSGQKSIKVLHQPYCHLIHQRQLQSPGHPGSFHTPETPFLVQRQVLWFYPNGANTWKL